MVKVEPDNSWKPNWYLILYYIVCILIAANLAGWLWNTGRPVAAILALALLFLVFVFFGLRWFNAPDGKSAAASCSKTVDPKVANCGDCTELDSMNPWPPSINMCPDFMVAYTEPTGRVLCYDVNNTYEMKTASGAGLQTGLTINGAGGQSAYVLKDPGQGSVNSTLCTPEGNKRYPLMTLIKDGTMFLNDPKGKYVKWEGVNDGISPNICRVAKSLP